MNVVITNPEVNCGVPVGHNVAAMTWNSSTINSSVIFQCFDGSTVEVFCKEEGWDYPAQMCQLHAGK